MNSCVSLPIARPHIMVTTKQRFTISKEELRLTYQSFAQLAPKF